MMAGEVIKGNRPLSRYASPTGFEGITHGGPGRQIFNIQSRPMMYTTSAVAATNELIWTDDFTNGAWVKTGVTVASTTEIAPDVLKFATKLTGSSGNTIKQTTATSFNNTERIWFSCFFKGLDNNPNTMKLKIDRGGSDVAFVTVELNDAWQYVEVSTLLSGNGTVTGTIEFNGSFSVYVFGPQIVRGTVFPIYMPSTATKGTYTKLVAQQRFTMHEDVSSGLATPLMQTPDSTTAILLESI